MVRKRDFENAIVERQAAGARRKAEHLSRKAAERKQEIERKNLAKSRIANIDKYYFDIKGRAPSPVKVRSYLWDDRDVERFAREYRLINKLVSYYSVIDLDIIEGYFWPFQRSVSNLKILFGLGKNKRRKIPMSLRVSSDRGIVHEELDAYALLDNYEAMKTKLDTLVLDWLRSDLPVSR